MNSQKIINLLTMCRRANKMVMGFDVSINAIRDGLCKHILIASNTSQKTVKELNYQISKANYRVQILKVPLSMEEIYSYINQYVGIIAICDDGFGKAFEKLINSNQSENV